MLLAAITVTGWLVGTKMINAKRHNKALHLTAKSVAPIVALLVAAGELGR